MTALARGVIIYMERKLDSLGRKCQSSWWPVLWLVLGATILPIRFNGECNVQQLVVLEIYLSMCSKKSIQVHSGDEKAMSTEGAWLWVLSCELMVYPSAQLLFYNHCRCDSPVYAEIGPWFSFIQKNDHLVINDTLAASHCISIELSNLI